MIVPLIISENIIGKIAIIPAANVVEIIFINPNFLRNRNTGTPNIIAAKYAIGIPIRIVTKNASNGLPELVLNGLGQDKMK